MRDAHVEMARRFVEQQNRRLLREAERNPDALTFARAQRREERARANVFHADRRERALRRPHVVDPRVCHCHQR